MPTAGLSNSKVKQLLDLGSEKVCLIVLDPLQNRKLCLLRRQTSAVIPGRRDEWSYSIAEASMNATDESVRERIRLYQTLLIEPKH